LLIKEKHIMKNPFIRENNSGLWIAAAGAAAWLYIKRNTAVPEPDEHATDYLQPKPAKHRKTTDVNELHPIAAG
jgi:hypothetical protein